MMTYEPADEAKKGPSTRMSGVISFCRLADVICELDPVSPETAVLDIEGTPVEVHDADEDAALLVFLPLLEAALPEVEQSEGCRLLATRFPIPAEFDGLASYDDVEFGRGGLLAVLPMPRRFSPDLFADALELVAETIARISAGMESA